MAGTKGMTHYERSIKDEAVRLFKEEGHTYRHIAEQLGISKANRIEIWISQYQREGGVAFAKPIGRPRKIQDEKAYI